MTPPAPFPLPCRPSRGAGLLGLAFALLLAARPAGAATIFDPAEPWITIETAHFRVNATRANLESARLVAAYAEEAHARLSPELDSEPERKTELTCLDEEDTTNGFGFPLPNNQIFIYLTSPHEDMLDSRYDAWLRDLVTHEYTHVLHLEKTRGLPALVKRTLGRSYFPNMFLPVFLIEGLAVDAETRHSTGGRGRSAYYEAITRLAALEDALPDIDRVSGYYVADHPAGELPYVYGMAFYRTLREQYGPDAARKLAERTAESPFFGLHGLDDAMRAVTGQDAAGLWAIVRADLSKRAQVERSRILARGPLTPLVPVTKLGQYQRHPMFTPEGKLAWSSYTGHGFSYLVREPDAPGASPKRLVGKSPFGAASFIGKGGVILAREPGDDRYTSQTDLFRFEPGKRTLKRLTKAGRLSDPAVSPDGRWVLAVRNGGGQSNLVALRPDGTGLRPLTGLADRAQFGAPAWHPGGELAAVSVWKDGARDPYLLDPGSGALTPLWRDRAVDQNLAFSPDGRFLVFSSDRDGVYNLYAADWKARRLFRLTNVLGALIEPAVSPDGKTLAAASYGVKGFDIVELPFDPAHAVEVPWPMDEPGLAQPAPKAPLPPPKAAGPYRAWPSFSPKFWAPFALWDGRGPIVGAASYGQDTLMRHFAYGAGGIGALSGRPYYVLSYSNDVLPPTISAYASEATTFGTVLAPDASRHDLAQTGRGQGLSVTFPGVPTAFLQNRWVTGDAFSLAWSASQTMPFGAVDPAIPADRLPAFGNRQALSLTYRYGDNYKFAYSVSPEGGSLVTLGYEKALPGSVGETDRVWADWRRYWGLPWASHHVLALRAQGGAGLGGPEQPSYFTGGAESATLLANVDLRTASTLGSRTLPVRGYGAYAQSGRNAFALSLEYRAPLVDIQRGWGVYPIFVRALYGAAFVDAGAAWSGPWVPGRTLLAVGAEARAQVFLQQAPTEVRLGLGQGLNPGGWPLLYAEAGSAF